MHYWCSTTHKEVHGWIPQFLRIGSKNEYVPAVKQYQDQRGIPVKKALLLLDNAPSHPGTDALVSENIRAKFLPPNTTSLVQPMDQGVLESFKRRYNR